jgi:hypothetical protein
MLGFGGRPGVSRERFGVCMVGYECDRAVAVIRAVEPSWVVLTVGSRPTRAEFLERNRDVVNEVLGSENYEITEIDVSDPNKSFTDLREIVNRAPANAAVYVAPLSTKLSCLAVWQLWLGQPSIRVCHAQPKSYNQLNYSKGSCPPRYFNVNWRGG